MKEERLLWDESQKHYLAISQIEDRYLPCNIPMNKNQHKKAEVKIFNDINEYLKANKLLSKLGGFYRVVSNEV